MKKNKTFYKKGMQSGGNAFLPKKTVEGFEMISITPLDQFNILQDNTSIKPKIKPENKEALLNSPIYKKFRQIEDNRDKQIKNNYDAFLEGKEPYIMDFGPKENLLKKHGGIIEDDMGQYNHPGKITKINSNNITMKGINYPVLGISDINDIKLMKPNKNYKFKGSTVTEIPLVKKGKKLKKAQLGDDLLTGQQSIPVVGTSYPSVFNQTQSFNQYPQFEEPLKMDMQGELSESPLMKQSGIGDITNKIGSGNILNGIGLGISMLSQERKNKLASRQGLALSNITKQASSIKPETIKRKYVRPEDQLIDPNELYPSYGTGTNYLAKHGKELKKANLGSNIGSWISGNKFQQTGAGQIGETIGSILPVPFGKQIGGFLGGIVGGLTNKETMRNEEKMLKNLQTSAFQEGIQDFQFQNSSFMQHGGKSNMNGDLKVHWGGKAETVSLNPYLPDGGETIEFKGNSHDNGGIGMTFGKSTIEVETGEPAVKLRHGGKGESLTVFGDLKATAVGDKESKGKTFKSYIKELNEQENKQNKILDKSTKLLENPVNNSFDRLKFSSGEALNIGANMKLKTLADKKEYAAIVQNAILETSKEMGIKSDKLAEGKIHKASKSEIAKHGKNIPKYQIGGKSLPIIEDPIELLKKEFQPPANPYQTINRGEEQPYLNVGWGYTPDRNQLTRTIPGNEFAGQIAPKAIPGGTIPSPGWENAITEKIKKYGFDEVVKAGDILDTPGNRQKWDIFGSGKSRKPDYINIKDIVNNPPVTGNPPTDTTLDIPPLEQIPTDGKRKFPWEMLPNLRPTNQTPLDPNQLMGEMYALSNNQLEPVQAQKYQPLLEQPYDISLQDQMNANQADFNKISNFMQNNPSAQAALAGQKYAANSSVLGEQMRINQGQKAGVFARNRQTLNDAQFKNLGILDQQYVRQATAKSNTKAVTQSALNSIASKIQQHKLENRTLGVYENLYNYWYGPQGHAWNVNPPAIFNTDIQGIPPQNNSNTRTREEIRQKYSKTGIPDGSEVRKTTYKDGKKSNGGLVKAMKGANLKSYC